MAHNNKHNMLYFEGSSMRELHNNMDEWQRNNKKRFLSMSVKKDGDSFCCIALTNPSEIIIVDGQASGGAQVGKIQGINHLAARPQQSCFPATASVLTSKGIRSMGDIKRGDMVVSYSPEGTTTLRPVTRKFKHGTAPISRVVLNDGTNLQATSNHTILTNRGWLRIDKIIKGDYLVRKDDIVCVIDVHSELIPEPVYNLYTAFEHTFVVDGIVVHNFTTLRVFRTWFHQNLIDPIYYLMNKNAKLGLDTYFKNIGWLKYGKAV
tara:strand:- start:162 stop:953 length:792 start_codon:yes stop_codon:yes gene_type:complete